MDQRRCHRRINAARQSEQHFVSANLSTHPRHRFINVGRHVPVAAKAADAVHETLDHRRTLHGMRDLGMKLHCVETTRLVRHRGDRGGRVAGNDLESRRQFGDLVAMAHPHIEQAVAFRIDTVLNVFEQCRMTARTHFGITKLTYGSALDFATELRRHRLHAVADAEHRHAERKHRSRGARCIALPNRVGAAGENDAARIVLPHEIVADVMRVQFAINAGLAHAARNQLRVLRAEIKNENFVVGHISGMRIKNHGLWVWPAKRVLARPTILKSRNYSMR